MEMDIWHPHVVGHVRRAMEHACSVQDTQLNCICLNNIWNIHLANLWLITHTLTCPTNLHVTLITCTILVNSNHPPCLTAPATMNKLFVSLKIKFYFGGLSCSPRYREFNILNEFQKKAHARRRQNLTFHL